jgi:hypothetical protein
MTTISLSLISHTNVGKTTLARTLLRADVGEIRDAAHVTETSARYTLIETTQRDSLELWDTPGFGDSARLLRRLEQSGRALGWFLSEVWDRYTDRPFYSSQQAIRNVQQEADVVLYLVNASEDPATAGYVDAEMRLLGWIGKPVLVLLNQLGPPRPAGVERADVERWAGHLAAYDCVRDTLAFDAFARCWVQEHVLLDHIRSVLPAASQDGFGRLAAAWRDRNQQVFRSSMEVLARQLLETAGDRVNVPVRGIGDTARDWFGSVITGKERVDPAYERAMAELASRLDGSLRRATDELIALHGLTGRSAQEIFDRMGSEFAVTEGLDEGKASLLGAAVSGALGGLAADIAAGGLTFGAGALIGGMLGLAGARGIARAYNLSRGTDASVIRWSGEFLSNRATAAVMRYLAVAHFGRGRGDFVEGEYPAHWRELVQSEVASRGQRLARVWSAAEQADRADRTVALRSDLEALLSEIISGVLAQLYPDSIRPRVATPDEPR